MGATARGGLLAVLVCAAPPCLAEGRLEPPDLQRYLRWGPVRVRPALELTHFGYDNNILAGTSSSDEVGDYTASLSPSVDGLVLLGASAFVEFREALEFTGYLENEDQNFMDQRGKARITVPWRGMGFFTDLTLDRVHDRPVDQLDIRPERSTTEYGLGVILEPGWRTEVEIGRFDRTILHVDRDEFTSAGQTVSERLDREEERAELAVSYRLRGRSWLTLDAQVGSIDFTDPDPRGVEKDSRDWTILPGVRIGEEGPLSGFARFGWAENDADEPTRPDFTDLVGESELVYRPGRTRLALNVARRPGFSVQAESTYTLDTRATLQLVRYLNPMIGVETAATHGRLTFPGSTPGTPEREDQLRRYEAGIRLRLGQDALGRRLVYTLKVVRDSSDSSIPDLYRTRTMLDMGVVVGVF
jgi:hypothetical protein